MILYKRRRNDSVYVGKEASGFGGRQGIAVE